ncbi:MAG TPA: hypothetical protein VIT87_07870, partial [Gemmatimonadales bacterium]
MSTAGQHAPVAGHGADLAEGYRPVFVGPIRSRLEELFTKYPTKQACLLPALWMVQEARGWISEPAI